MDTSGCCNVRWKKTDPDWSTNPLLNQPFEFYTTVNVDTETKATLHLIVDNFATVELNGVTIQCPSSSEGWCIEEYRASCMAWEYRRESVTTDADDVVPYLWQNEDGEYQEI